MVNKNKTERPSSRADGTRDAPSQMDNKSMQVHARRRSTRSRAPTEEVSLVDGEVAAEIRLDDVNGDLQPASRATSVSELTESDMEARSAKRARSKRSTPKDYADASRASSPLTADDEPMAGHSIPSHLSNASASGVRQSSRPIDALDNGPPSTPPAPHPAYGSSLSDFASRPANQSIANPQANHVVTPHNVFRPPPSAALAIFDRPPSPSFYNAVRNVGEASRPVPAVQVAHPSLNPFNSPGGSTGPKIKLSLSGLKATTSPAPAPISRDESLHPRHPRTSISVPQRTNSLVSTDTSPYAIGRLQKGKGKAKANTPHIFDNTIPNHDYCAACKGVGSFLCCDGCPRSFHFMCLDPPLTIDELPEDDKWYCKACQAARRPKSFFSPYKGMFAELLQVLDDRNPREFQLPEDIRTFFAGIRTDPDGAYSAAVDVKPVKFDRAGFPEERDSYKLKSKGHTILCYKCKGSAAPIGPKTAEGLAIGRSIVSCDYCPLSWHLDCLDPPAAIMPTSQRKWMCPNHAAQIMPKKRLLKNGVEVITVNQPGQRNNGLIDIIDAEAEKRRIAYQNMFINGKRYKVPEKIIQLDFWTKLGIKGATSSSAASAHAMPYQSEHDVDSLHEKDESHTIESLFGGQSPLSSAPSSYLASPQSVIAALPMIDENGEDIADASVDAAQILLELSHGGRSCGKAIDQPTSHDGNACRNQPQDLGQKQSEVVANDFAKSSASPTDMTTEEHTSTPDPPRTNALDTQISSMNTPPPTTTQMSDGNGTPVSARKIRLRLSTPLATSSLKEGLNGITNHESNHDAVNTPSPSETSSSSGHADKRSAMVDQESMDTDEVDQSSNTGSQMNVTLKAFPLRSVHSRVRKRSNSSKGSLG